MKRTSAALLFVAFALITHFLPGSIQTALVLGVWGILIAGGIVFFFYKRKLKREGRWPDE